MSEQRDREENSGVLGDVAHPFDQTNGILDDFDETHPGNVSGESPGEFAEGDDTPVVPPAVPPTSR